MVRPTTRPVHASLLLKLVLMFGKHGAHHSSFGHVNMVFRVEMRSFQEGLEGILIITYSKTFELVLIIIIKTVAKNRLPVLSFSSMFPPILWIAVFWRRG